MQNKKLANLVRLLILVVLTLVLVSCSRSPEIPKTSDDTSSTNVYDNGTTDSEETHQEIQENEDGSSEPDFDEGEIVGSSCDHSKISNDEMPVLSDFYLDFYRMVWSDDGYPMRDDGFEHPLYPKYVLTQYLAAYERNPSELYKDAICRVAHAAVRRMEPYRDALVIWYEPNPNYKRLYDRHYSALTQSYYANILFDVGTLLDDSKLLDVAEKSFLSLLIPKEDNGVLFQSRFGPTIEEVPQTPNSYILNGWLSALQSSWEYWEKSGDSRAYNLVVDSVRTLVQILPLYDVDTLSNSRYGLTGPVRVRITSGSINDAAVTVPEEGVFGLVSVSSPKVWQNYQLDDSTINVVFSLASWPDENILTLEVDQASQVEVCLSQFSPTTDAYLRCSEWVRIGEVTPEIPEVLIPWYVVEVAAVPTNFIKVIDGNNTNVYHAVHVRRLFQLGLDLNSSELIGWAEEWLEAACNWKNIDLYEGLYGSEVVDPRYAQEITKINSLPVEELC